jgi:hypothetical protein
MAKMFYSLDEAKAALGKSEEEIKQFTREGKLREFRDGQKLMFKADQIAALKAELSGAHPDDEIGGHPADSGLAIGLADSQGAGSGLAGLGSGIGSGIGSGGGSGLGGSGLGGSGLGGIGSGIGSGLGSGLGGSGLTGSGLALADTGSGASSSGSGMSLKEDTALAADLGLSGSMGGMPSPSRPGSGTGSMAGGSSGSISGSVHGSKPGVDIFQSDDVDRVDPSAQTAISGGVSDVGSDGVGSGSGLLDLTRESDDTSLGAELLDEIAPGGTGVARRPPGETASGSAFGGTALGGTAIGKTVEIRGSGGLGSRAQAGGAGPVVFEEPDPMAPAFAGAALAATIVVLFGAYALVAGVLDNPYPDIVQTILKYGFIGVAAGGLVLVLIFFVVGLVLGKSAR